MPWCPKCKNEYREGFTVCSECNVELVEELESIAAEDNALVFTTEKKERINAFIEYLEYSGIHSYSALPDENDYIWSLFVSKDDYKKASKLFTGFAIAESERVILEQSCDNVSDEEILPNEFGYDEDITELEENEVEIDDEISEKQQQAIDDLNERMEFNEMNEAPSTTYVRKSEKAKDYLSSAYTLIVCGAVGLVFIILNFIGVISFVSSIFSQIIFLILFAAFFVGGIKMYINSKSIAEDVDAEEAIEKAIENWLNENITAEYLESIKDETTSDEINYFSFCETIRTRLHEEFADADPSMIETLMDEHLTKFI